MDESSKSEKVACDALTFVETFANVLQDTPENELIDGFRVSSVLADAFVVLDDYDMPAKVRRKVVTTLIAVVKAFEAVRASQKRIAVAKTKRVLTVALAVVALVVVVIAAWKSSFVVALLLFMFAASCLGVNVDWRLLLKRVKEVFNPST